LPEIRMSASNASILLQMLETMKVVTSTRKNDGWELFQDDEEWDYEVVGDFRTCYVCNRFAGPWVGSQIPVVFGHYMRWGQNHVKPGTHADYPELKPSNDPDAYLGCRCNLFWLDYMDVLLMRLDRELRDSVISVFEGLGFAEV
jgi:hypothetical protein